MRKLLCFVLVLWVLLSACAPQGAIAAIVSC
jgi:hypothetical protein